jgi:serine protease
MKQMTTRKVFNTILILLFVVTGLHAQTLVKINSFRLPDGSGSDDYVNGVIIFKILPSTEKTWVDNKSGSTDLDRALNDIHAGNIQKVFPNKNSVAEKADKWGRKTIDLSLIYQCAFNEEIPIEKAINAIISSGMVEYAQPRYIQNALAYFPSDPLYINQYQLDRLNMFDAWDIEKGDTNIVIGIVDWGTEVSHPDLVNNIKYNYEDPINGYDDDNDGYVDNYYGWDMGCNDNDPTGLESHGTDVAGLASAATDNGTGIAGIGFKCKFIPIKVADQNNFGTMCYEGIVYAADHGCKVINCSWGGTFYEGPYGQDIINYAAINRNAIIVAACGNANNELLYYPASYDNVISVAATNSADERWSGSSYGYMVDLCAPGKSVWTTGWGGTYGSSTGTSMASPVAAGAAALLWAHFPAYNAMQIAEQLKVTCDNIDTIPVNLAYSGLLGHGRINMYRALTDTTITSIEMINIIYTDADHNNIFEPGDTVSVSGDFLNYLAPSGAALIAHLSALNPYSKMVDSVFLPGSIPTMSTVNNNSNPFRFIISSVCPTSEVLVFNLNFSDTGYQANQYLRLTVNIDFINVDTNKINVTITSNGVLGYNHGNSEQGVGFTYNYGQSLMSAGGFVTGISPAQVSDAIYGFTGEIDQDFLSLDNVAKVTNPLNADFETYGVFNDSLAAGGPMHIIVKHRTLAWNSPGREKFVILEYSILNGSITPLADFYAGYFVDWDINNGLENIAGFDSSLRLGYISPFYGGTYAGIKLLSPGGINNYAFDNNGDNGSIQISDGFTGLEKYFTLQNSRNEAGTFAPGNDVSEMISTGPFIINQGDSINVAFALMAGDHLADIQSVANEAQLAYNQILSNYADDVSLGFECSISPNPFTNDIVINFKSDFTNELQIEVYNILGSCVYSSNSITVPEGLSTVKISGDYFLSGIYYLRINSREGVLVKEMLKL